MDVAVARALAEPLRMTIVEMLAAGQLCTCHLVADTGATQTNISNHLRVLRDAGVIASAPAGRYTYHRLIPDRLEAASAVLAQLASSARVAGEAKRPCG